MMTWRSDSNYKFLNISVGKPNTCTTLTYLLMNKRHSYLYPELARAHAHKHALKHNTERGVVCTPLTAFYYI
jgi:hypothetical protein